MADAQLQPSTTLEQQQEKEERQPPPPDDFWARPPPGAPNYIHKPAISNDRQHQRQPTRDFSLEDLEVARALTGLRQSSPAEKIIVGPDNSTYEIASSSSHPEPLLSLLTSQHPFIGHAINHSLSAYNVGKQYSGPLRSSVDFVERNIASPVASTVGTAGRISGVENGVRWWLQRRSSPSNGTSEMSSNPSNGHKRRRGDSEGDLEQGLPPQRSRAPSDLSMAHGEYLPAYDTNRSPSYSSRDPHPAAEDEKLAQYVQTQQGGAGLRTWQSRLIYSTSGLGVAMSHESRRSLKYCLSWLRWANGKLGRTLYTLQTVLSEYEAAQRQAVERSNGAQSDHYSLPHQPRDLKAISAQLTALKDECVKTLQAAMDVVSKYAGGALPENARMVVRNHLTSLPQRFAFMASLQEKEEEVLRRNAEARRHGSADTASASSSAPTGTESAAHSHLPSPDSSPSLPSDHGRSEQDNVILGARRVVVLAREGLDMMTQVSTVVDGTITSAEQWCERLGRTTGDEEQALATHDDEAAIPQPQADKGSQSTLQGVLAQSDRMDVEQSQ